MGDHDTPMICRFQDGDRQCIQRAIVHYEYCIRHILLDETAPYKRCQGITKSNSDEDPSVRCTNPIHINRPENLCSTHLILLGRRTRRN
ncbi:hypothetical protein QR680_014698 [Steinernema hermaphroditum]|uniref:KANL2-like probable zinc-finger domain-containing protein n=1 Tax=Steinernema hermaphroditum TaxID=289476 RepID=A0AA39M3P1_9BILA|nr:hypothetical protein QR680_014698 [Steinernema hermaphroditum]